MPPTALAYSSTTVSPVAAPAAERRKGGKGSRRVAAHMAEADVQAKNPETWRDLVRAPKGVRPARHRAGTAATLVFTVVCAAREFATLFRTGPRAAVRAARSPWTYPAAVLMLLIWAFAIVGDAYTTMSMMSTGMFVEANPVAAAGMSVVGVGVYVLLASVVCTGLAFANVGVASGKFAYLMMALLTLVAIFKARTALANMLLWNAPYYW